MHDYDVTAGTVGWDARVREIWGIGPDEVVTFDAFLGGVHPADRAATQAAIDAAMASGGDGRYRTTFRVLNAADGSEHWVAATGQVLFSGERPVRLVGTVEDITDRYDLKQAVHGIELAAETQDERKRLARELHDSTTQALFAATLKAEALSVAGDLQPGPATETLEELRRLSRGRAGPDAHAPARAAQRTAGADAHRLAAAAAGRRDGGQGRDHLPAHDARRGSAACPGASRGGLPRRPGGLEQRLAARHAPRSAWVLLETAGPRAA